jgi:hypothetical protein
MTAYALAWSPCVQCGTLMSYHPHKVPSVRINGVRQPLCETCVKRANPLRRERGLEEIPIQPGAYDPCPESEL